MLGSDDVDDDFITLTPTSRTNLANIFVGDNEKASENPTLKYVAPKPQDIQTSENNTNVAETQQKISECILALALFAYELIDNSYIPRGKLGFAIMKINTPSQVKLVLYDSAKNTLSHATVNSKLEITRKDNYITYYDDLQKNWSLLCSDSQDGNNIIEELKKYNATISVENMSSLEYPSIPPKPTQLTLNTKDQSDKGSDTDSSLNKKTKKAILSRMAMMGQSILPPQPLTEVTSDSSDTNEYNNHKIVRHKPLKNSKKNNQDKCSTEEHIVPNFKYENSQQNIVRSTLQPMNTNSSDIMPIYSYVNGQMVPVTRTIGSMDIDRQENFNIVLSEQRVSNSELRININRMSDKIDQVLDKIKICENPISTTSSFTNELCHKLLMEYENKIKEQEKKIKLLEKNINDNIVKSEIYKPNTSTNDIKEDYDTMKETYELKITELKTLCVENDNEIKSLKNEICLLKADKHENKLGNLDIPEEIIDNTEFENLKHDYLKIVEALGEEKKKNNSLQNNFDGTVKNIMNSTYHTLSANFENENNYSGENIKKVIGTVIKKITIDALNG